MLQSKPVPDYFRPGLFPDYLLQSKPVPDYLVDLLVYLLLTDINAQVGDVINHSTGIAMPSGINDIDPSDNCASQNNLITDIIFYISE